MSVTETELEQLEASLDGELSAGEEDALRGRVESDPEWSAALELLREERGVRAAAFRSFEPSDAVAKRVAMRLKGAIDREQVWGRRWSKLRIGSAAAACIVVGFIVGWVGRGSGAGGHQDANLFLATGTNGSPVAGSLRNPTGPTVVSFPIRDQHGNVIGYQKFDSPQRANEFIDDLTRQQQRHEQQLQNGNLTYTSDGKF